MNLFSSERNHNWLIWIWCIKFHLFLWKLSDVFIAINRFANKFNIYISILFNYVINFIHQMFCWRCFPRNCFTSLLCLSWSLGLPPFIEKRLIFPRRLDFVLDFPTGAWWCARGWSESLCTSSLLLLGLWHHLSAIKMTLSTKFIISSSSWSLQNLLNSTTVLHYFSATKMYATLYLFGFIDTKIYSTICLYICTYWHKDIHRYVTTAWAKKSEFRWMPRHSPHHAQSVALLFIL